MSRSLASTTTHEKLGNLGSFPVTASVSLFAVKDQMMTPKTTTYPLSMEETGSGYGYLLYSFDLKNYHHENKLKVVEASDRLHIYVDGDLAATQYQETVGEELLISGQTEKTHLR